MKAQDFDWSKAFLYIEKRTEGDREWTIWHHNRNNETEDEKFIERLVIDAGKLIEQYYKEKLNKKEE